MQSETRNERKRRCPNLLFGFFCKIFNNVLCFPSSFGCPDYTKKPFKNILLILSILKWIGSKTHFCESWIWSVARDCKLVHISGKTARSSLPSIWLIVLKTSALSVFQTKQRICIADRIVETLCQSAKENVFEKKIEKMIGEEAGNFLVTIKPELSSYHLTAFYKIRKL